LHIEQARRPWKPGRFPQLKIVAQSFLALAPEDVDAPAAKPAAATCLRQRRRPMRGEPSRSLHIVDDAFATDIAKPPEQ
jgi:hypothetical protein